MKPRTMVSCGKVWLSVKGGNMAAYLYLLTVSGHRVGRSVMSLEDGRRACDLRADSSGVKWHYEASLARARTCISEGVKFHIHPDDARAVQVIREKFDLDIPVPRQVPAPDEVLRPGDTALEVQFDPGDPDRLNPPLRYPSVDIYFIELGAAEKPGG